MKKSLFLLLALVLVLGGCGSKPAEVGQAKPEKLTGSIEDLMAKNKSIRCELIAKADAAISSGTTYIADGKARVDYQGKISGSLIGTSHMINDGTWLYTWSEENPEQSIKMKLDSLPKETNSNTNAAAGVENYQSQYDYNCYTWVKDNTMFTPPADVNFQDYTKMMQSLQGIIGNTNASGGVPNLNNIDKSALCSSCDSMPNASTKATCRQQLGCK